jgi:(p)ppGpp synthase/HD superfamily hydrolase
MTGPVAKARAFAVAAHGDQRYGDAPYVAHLDAVARVLREHSLADDVWQAAAYLHDVIEDTAATASTLLAGFPEAVVDLVAAVTNEPGKNRRERAAATYPKIRRSPVAVGLKLADRIANVEASRRSGGSLLAMYQREHASFRAALHRDGEWLDLWTRLDAAMKESP